MSEQRRDKTFVMREASEHGGGAGAEWRGACDLSRICRVVIVRRVRSRRNDKRSFISLSLAPMCFSELISLSASVDLHVSASRLTVI